MRHRTAIASLLLLLATALPAQETGHNFDVAKNLDIFNSLYRDLDMLYVDTIDADKTVQYAIRAMLYSLDPYTIYYPEEEVKNLRQMITGKYAGIGSLIRQNLKEGCCVIDQPYRGMPAQEVGLRKGDRILAIDDTTMIGKPTDYVSSHLRGDAGSTFMLRYLRHGEEKERTMSITRRSIQLPAVSYYGMLNDSIGYINLDQFTEDCAKEVRQAFISLKLKGMKRLIFDLRENGGGAVSEAISILNLFVPNDTVVLTMRGKTRRAHNEYKTSAEPVDTVIPIVVMVNDATASASEIMAGVLQDFDRAVVLGTQTYGKGLVQATVDVPYNGQLKLTTSKYYLPTGRCLQAIDYSQHGNNTIEHTPDSLAKVFYTNAGRPVREGGGIMPDVVMQGDTLTNLAYYLINARDSAEVAFTFVCDYIAAHPTIDSPSTFELTDEDFAEVKRRVIESNFTYDKQTEKYLQRLKELARFEGYYDAAKDEFDALEAKLTHDLSYDLDINKDLLLSLLARDIVGAYYYEEGAIKYSLRHDNQITRAIDLLSADEYHRLLAPPAPDSPAEDAPAEVSPAAE